MQAGDWFNGAAILAVGVFLGLAADSMVDLAGTASWPLITIIPVLFGGAFLCVVLLDSLIDRVFPSGVKPSSKTLAKKRKPFALLMSLPAGIAIGVIGAQLGLSDLLL